MIPAPDKSPLIFIPFTEDHLPQIMTVTADAYPDSWSERMFRDELGNRLSRFYSAFNGDTLVGYGGYWMVADEAHITTIAIAPAYRGRGLGRQLLEHLIDTATAEGATLVALETRHSNTPALALYTRLGFRQVGRRKAYYAKTNEDAIVMMKELG